MNEEKSPITLEQVLDKKEKQKQKELENKHSAFNTLQRLKSLPEMKCKICKRHICHAEHEDVNMGICDDCALWYHRELFKEKKLPRNRADTE